MNSPDSSLQLPLFSLSAWGDEERSRQGKAKLNQMFNHGDSSSQPKSFHVRVPGRVNIIGEHIDYCGFGVLPMAIEQDILVTAVATRKENEKPNLTLLNLGTAYLDFSCPIDKIRDVLNERVVGESPPWHMYFLCGALGVLEWMEQRAELGTDVCAVIDGCIPARAGLSSSSALVVSGAITTLVALNLNMDKKELAELCAKSERFIGTQGGGMDQAITILATKGSALNIEFVPGLSWEVVGLPDTAVFIIANSLVEANKAASSLYNNRVAECRLATWILAKKAGASFRDLTKLKELQLKLAFDHKAMMKLMNEALEEQPYDLTHIAQVLDIDIEELKGDPLLQRIKLPNGDFPLFKIYQRCKHVLQESGRVEEFRSLSESSFLSCVGEGESELVLRQLGHLMNESHRSLKELFECSASQLDLLVGISQGISFGARLTGAGWGGCMVALLKRSQVPMYLETVKREYYEPLHGISDIQKHVFISEPGSGAAVYKDLIPSL